MKNQMAKRIASVLLAGVMLVSLAACGENKKTEEKKTDDSKKSSKKETEIQVFIAASLNTVMTELAKEYNEDHPEVKITFNAHRSKRDMSVTCSSLQHRSRWISLKQTDW